MYYIYHIPKIKIGCTDNVEERTAAQKFHNYEVLEEHIDIYIASDREIALQKQYGLPIDKIPYWQTIKQLVYNPKRLLAIKNSDIHKKSVQKNILVAAKISNDRKLGYMNPEIQSKAGKIGGQKNKASGHIQELGRKQMQVLHSIRATCPHCNLTGKGPNMIRYHFDNCKAKPQ